MGSKLETQTHVSPGPADYGHDGTAVKSSAQNVAIGQSEREDLWAEQNRAEMPGPGTYYSDQQNTAFGQSASGTSMAWRHEEKIDMSPGPGHYDAYIETTRHGQTER